MEHRHSAWIAFFSFLLLATVCTSSAQAEEAVRFLRGTEAGCFQKADDTWVPIQEPRLPCPPRTGVKTEKKAWGTVIYPFGTLMVHPGSELQFQAGGILLTRGSFRAFITRSPGTFRFRQPQATLCVRGTIFSANADGVINIATGSVEQTPINGIARILTPDTASAPIVPEELPEVFTQIERALQADHDRKPVEAVEAFVQALNNPSLAGLPEYRSDLLEQCLQNLSQSGMTPDSPTVREVGKLLKTLPDVWYSFLERLLRQGQGQEAQRLLRLAPSLKPFDPKNARDQVIRSLVADATGNLKELEAAAKELIGGSATISQKDDPKGFWSDSSLYIKMLRFPKTVKPEMTSRLLHPTAMKGLSPAVARKRMAAINALPRDLLEAQGLFQLIRAYLAGGQWERANETLSYLAKNYPGSPLVKQAQKLVSQYRPVVETQRKRKPRLATPTVLLPPVSEKGPAVATEAVSAVESGVSGTEATGSVASVTVSPGTTEGSSVNSLSDGF